MKTPGWCRQVTEVGAAALAWVTIPFLPRCVVVSLAKICGGIGARVTPKLSRIAEANLKIAFGDAITAEERQDRIREAFVTFSLVMLDLFWFSRFTARRLRKYVHLDPDVMTLIRQPGAMIALTAHLGNWELLGQAMTLEGRPMSCVAAELDNSLLNTFLTRLRERTGQKIIAKKGALRALVTTLHNGGAVAFVLDQNTVPRDGGTFVPLFGLPTTLAMSAAALALRLKAPMSFLSCIHDGSGHFHTHTIPVPIASEGMTEAGLTAMIAQKLEVAVRQAPGQWLWMYKRWKFIAEEPSAVAYPFYARKISPEEMGRGEHAKRS